MSRYGFEESIRDGATLPLHFEPRLVELRIDKEAIDEAYAELTGGLSDLDREDLAKASSKMAVLVKVPERVEKICADIARHFQEKVAPNGFKAMVVTFDQESCLLYKAALDQHLDAEASEIVISVSGKEREDARYRGVFDDVAKALEFDEAVMRRVVSAIDGLKAQLPAAIQKCLAYFAGVDRAVSGYEGLIAAQECLPNNDVRDAFAVDYSNLSNLWEALSPDPVLQAHEADYRWLSQVYVSVQPTSGTGALIWHSLGAKTIELIHQNVHVTAVRDDLEEIVLDAELLEAVLGAPDPGTKAKEIEFKVMQRLRRRMGNPRLKKLSERLEQLKDRHERGQLNSVEFLKMLLELARDLVQAEKETPPAEDEDRGKAALTELFEEVRNEDTPIVVERIVNDIDEIVRLVRFPGWPTTSAGEREVRKALRKTLFKYKLHQDAELFEKAYEYIRQYY